MNICLTMKCNNHCPYCFQRPIKEQYDDMSLETFKNIINWSNVKPDQPIKILGGEPTICKNFPEFLNYGLEKYPINNFVIITNLLGLDDNINFIADKIKDKDNISFLVNTTYDIDKKNIFLKNLKKIYDIRPENITLSITLMQNKKNNEKNIDNIISLLKQFPEIPTVRIGVELPTIGYNFFIYNYDDEIDILMQQIFKIRECININLDCGVTYCQISKNILDKYFLLDNVKLGCCSPVTEIHPDCSSSYCASGNQEYFVNNIFNFQNITELNRYYLSLEYKNQIKNKICLKCNYYKTGECIPCHCFDDALFENELKI